MGAEGEQRGGFSQALGRHWKSDEDRSKIQKLTVNMSWKERQQHKGNAVFGSSFYLKPWQVYNSGQMTSIP